MPIVNVLIKTLGDTGVSPKKFLMLLDSALKNQIKAFQLMPSGLYPADSGDAGADPLNDPNQTPILGNGPGGSSNQLIVFELDGATDPLFVGMQGSGEISDNTKFTSEVLLWKVISIAGPPPPGWPSMDIFQDLPAPPNNQAFA
jgi:hypothetical protein